MNIFIQSLFVFISDALARPILLLFTPKFFTILKSNLSNESDRKITEAILIKLFNPSLNVKHATDGSHRKPWNLTLPI